jgi:hypothetical protein
VIRRLISHWLMDLYSSLLLLTVLADIQVDSLVSSRLERYLCNVVIFNHRYQYFESHKDKEQSVDELLDVIRSQHSCYMSISTCCEHLGYILQLNSYRKFLKSYPKTQYVRIDQLPSILSEESQILMRGLRRRM